MNNIQLYRPDMHEVMEYIKLHDHFLLIAHKKPDGDTVGSITAMANVLERWGKNFVAYCKDLPDHHYRFLPLVEKITKDDQFVLTHQPYECVIVFDSGDLAYAGVDTLVSSLSPRPFIINIDHHRTNTRYGDINVVVETAASTTEVVAAMFEAERVEMTQEIATCLLTGLVTDTGSFTNPATSVSALNAASMLVEHGGKFRTILKQLVANRTLPSLRLWAECFNRLQVIEPWNIAVTVITKEDQETFGIAEEQTEGIANFLNSLAGVNAIMVLKEQLNGFVKASLRTTREDIDVARFAQFFGGGGHKKAAGFTVAGKLEKTSDSWRIV